MSVTKREAEVVKFCGSTVTFYKENERNVLPASTEVYNLAVYVAEGKVTVKASRKIDGGECSSSFTGDSMVFKGVKNGKSLFANFQMRPDGPYTRGVCADHVRLLRNEGIVVDKDGSINIREAVKALGVINEGRANLGDCGLTKARLDGISTFAAEVEEASDLREDIRNLLKSKTVSGYIEKKKMQTMFMR